LVKPDTALNVVQLMLGESIIQGNRNRLEPKLGGLPIALYVNMPWFRSVGGEKTKV